MSHQISDSTDVDLILELISSHVTSYVTQDSRILINWESVPWIYSGMGQISDMTGHFPIVNYLKEVQILKSFKIWRV